MTILRDRRQAIALLAATTALPLVPSVLRAQEQFSGGPEALFGPGFNANAGIRNARDLMASRTRPNGTTERVAYWSTITVDSSGIDHSPLEPGETRTFGHQLGPGRASRAAAIPHIAMYDAMLAARGGRYQSYTGIPSARGHVSDDAAIAQAAHDTLVALYPSHAPTLDTLLDDDLHAIRDPRHGILPGIALGRRAARAILSLRSDDRSQHVEPRAGTEHRLSNLPGHWRPDPVSKGPLAIGAHWGRVDPFGIDRVNRFRPPAPPSLHSREYTRAFDQLVALGGDGVQTPTRRSRDQTFAGIFWAYDGTPSLCAPPRLYNQIVLHIARQERTFDPLDLLRLLALANISMADAATVCWEAKYRYDVWRPVTGVREASEGTGPTGRGDGNPNTRGIRDFMPLGAPASNLTGPNFTPPFPAYPSGHATMGGALFETLRQFYRTDNIPFTFTSDELNGVTVDNQGVARALRPRTFSRLSDAEWENALSRIYLGVHWIFDVEEGVRTGRKVARYVFDNNLTRSRW